MLWTWSVERFYSALISYLQIYIFSSLSMYYFECCHKQDRHGETEKIEKVIFSTPHGHKHVGTRGFEFDSSYPQFLELFFSVRKLDISVICSYISFSFMCLYEYCAKIDIYGC